VLLHGVGTSSGEWSWVLPDLARNHCVYAIDLPGYDGSYEPADYSPAFTASFVNSFLDAVRAKRAVVVGNSLGRLVALHLALSEPERVSALVLSDSAGLGRWVNPALMALSFPGGGELAKALTKTPPGAAQRAFRRALLMFARPWQIRWKWVKDQYKLAQLPNFTDATLASLRTAVGATGQREVVLDRLPQLQMPTLIIGGLRTGCFRTLRRKRRSLSSKTAPSSLSQTVVIYLTSSNPSGSYQPSEISLASNIAKSKQTLLFTKMPLRSLLGTYIRHSA